MRWKLLYVTCVYLQNKKKKHPYPWRSSFSRHRRPWSPRTSFPFWRLSLYTVAHCTHWNTPPNGHERRTVNDNILYENMRNIMWQRNLYAHDQKKNIKYRLVRHVRADWREAHRHREPSRHFVISPQPRRWRCTYDVRDNNIIIRQW